MEASVTISITARAAELRRKGYDIITMSAGEPDVDTPDNIKAAGIQAIRDGKTKYTAPASGLIELKEAICEKLDKENQLSYEPSQIVVTCGAKQVIFDAIAAVIDPGDEVVLPAPLYVSYANQVKLMGGVPKIIQTDPADNFNLTARQLASELSPKSKLIIFNSPSNPTGATYTPERWAELAQILASTCVYVITDEIYEKFNYDGGEHTSIAVHDEDLRSRTLVVNGFSKAYAMTGWRVGYGAGPQEWMTHIAKIQSQETTNTCTISQHAAIEALRGPQESIPRMRDIFQKRRNLIADRFDDLDGVTCPRPDGAFYVFPNVQELLERTNFQDDVALCSYLLDEANVAAVPGAGFGTSGYVRFSYTLADDKLEEAISRVERAINKLG
ncbi:MAG: pyridoxal phosphate-dependent aminotransferase [Candidatus Latescibacterota bacterium]|nr:pyridoxal phosphate-dependent aminotransferase [Candidatus Latescibacterota bacterium]